MWQQDHFIWYSWGSLQTGRCQVDWRQHSVTDSESVIVMFDTSCPSRDDPRLKEYSMLFPNKLNTQEFLFCVMKKYCSVHLSWNTQRSPSIFLCFNTAISNSTRSTEKNGFYGRKTDSYSPVSSKSTRLRHYYLATSASPCHYYIGSDRLITME